MSDGDLVEHLRREITRAIVEQTGAHEGVATPYANAVLAFLQSEYAGDRLYIPAPRKRHDLLSIDAELRRGDRVWVVAKRHGLSRRQLRRLCPAAAKISDDDVRATESPAS